VKVDVVDGWGVAGDIEEANAEGAVIPPDTGQHAGSWIERMTLAEDVYMAVCNCGCLLVAVQPINPPTMQPHMSAVKDI